MGSITVTSHSRYQQGGVLTMITLLTINLLLIPLSTSAPQIQLLSSLPEDPIEDPADWAWGAHPDNGFDYKAKNSLTLKQCLQDPCKLLGTPLCETSYFHCQEYECIQRSEPCKKYCKLLNTC